MNSDLISVIVPIYNVEKYLNRCIDSILNQTFTNLEIILINDGSTDDSGKICNEYLKKDKRIKVYHKSNGGLSSARNEGINRAKGKYVTFIDSDDNIESDYVMQLYNLIKKYDVDLSITPYNVIYDKKKINIGDKYPECVMTTSECLDRLLCGAGFDVSACAKLYLRKLFKNISFPEGKLYEDNGTTYKLVMKCKKIAYNNKAGYNYYIREDSITTQEFNERKLDLLEMVDNMCNSIIAEYPDLFDAVLKKRIEANLSIYRQIVFVKSDDLKKIKKEIKEYLLSKRNLLFRKSKLSFRDKVGLLSLQFGDCFFKTSWKCYSFIKKRWYK